MRKHSVLLLTMVLVGSFAFANGTKERGSSAQGGDTVTVNTPVTITLWHTRGAGKNGEEMTAVTKKFNETNKLGITVEESYQGNYVATLAKTMQAIAAGTNPTMVLLERAAGVPVVNDAGALLDMMPYAKRDGMDLNNFPEALMKYSLVDGKLITLPYVRSTPVFYYNKGMYKDAGIVDAPKTIDELIAASKKITKIENGKTVVYGFELLNDPAWFVQNMTYQLGSNMLSADGKSAPSLEDGTLLKVLSAWRSWVDEGWCAAPAVTNASNALLDDFYNKRVGGFFYSTGGMANIIKNSSAAGIELGVAFLPTWDKPAAPVGGGNLGILSVNTSKQEQAAAWEFMKFLMEDEQVANNSAHTGYLPSTKSSVNHPILKQQWAEHPEFRVAFDQLSIAQEIPYSIYKSQYEEQMTVVCSKLIQDRSISPEQAIEELKAEAAQIFPTK
jgi:sn-glycerol 3-phosphate transport system substrate-binding protein